MPKKIQLQRHLATEELERRYRRAGDPVERSHYQIIWRLAQGKATAAVMEATGYSRGWIQQIAKRYNEGGAAGLGDRRHQNPGGQDRALLSPPQRQELGAALGAAPAAGGLWSGPTVARWITEKTGKRAGAQRGWEYLRRLGYTPQVPRPAQAHADAEQQAAFRKTSRSGCGR